MLKIVQEQFRDNPDLDIGRYQIPGYTGHFPGQNCYQGISKGAATKEALKHGGYLRHDVDHSILEPNRDDPQKMWREEEERQMRDEYFQLHDHDQGGKPIYREAALPGFTGHRPCTRNKIGYTFSPTTLDGTLEFERVRAAVPRYQFPLLAPEFDLLQPIGGRQNCATGNTDGDLVPIDAAVPLVIPRYMAHHHKEIIAQQAPPPNCYPGFPTSDGCPYRPETDSRYPPVYCTVNLDASNGQQEILHYSPEILPTPFQPSSIPVETEIKQPIRTKIVVPMPSWTRTMQPKLAKFNFMHAKSGFAGFIPGRESVLGSSMNRYILEHVHNRGSV